jgi:hypothetical protein
VTRTRAALTVQPLEDRLAPATFSAARVGGTLVVTQTSAAVGQIAINDYPATGTVTADDLGDANPAKGFSTAGLPSLAVRFQPADTTTAIYSINSARAGSVSLGVRNTAARDLILTGGAQIAGSLTVTGGNGGLTVGEVVVALHVGRNATFLGGAGLDTLDLKVLGGTLDGGTSVGGTLSAVRFNTVTTRSGDTLGRLSFNAAGEATPNSLTLVDTEVVGSLTYVGGTGSDIVHLLGTTRVGGDARVGLGTQLELDSSEYLQSSSTAIGGRVSVTGSPSGAERVYLFGAVGGAVAINLGGGTNSATLSGRFNGPTFGYVGGSGVDTVTYSPLDGSVHARFSARLGDGADAVTFGTFTANPSNAFIDFGLGADTFTGALNFSGQFLNLP